MLAAQERRTRAPPCSSHGRNLGAAQQPDDRPLLPGIHASEIDFSNDNVKSYATTTRGEVLAAARRCTSARSNRHLACGPGSRRPSSHLAPPGCSRSPSTVAKACVVLRRCSPAKANIRTRRGDTPSRSAVRRTSSHSVAGPLMASGECRAACSVRAVHARWAEPVAATIRAPVEGCRPDRTSVSACGSTAPISCVPATPRPNHHPDDSTVFVSA